MKQGTPSTLTDIAAAGRRAEHHAPFIRAAVPTDSWNLAVEHLAEGRLTLLDLWGEAGAVHIALLDEEAGEAAVASLECPDGRYPSVGRRHPPAIRLERAAADLFGLVPQDTPDPRAWLDHGQWGFVHPLGTRMPAAASPYHFLPAEGGSLHQIAVGPVHAGIIEPGHFRFTASGETIVRLEERLGYTHKGIEGLMAGAGIDRAAGLAGRTSGDSTVAYAFAFARAAEAALGIAVPPRAAWLRALMAELERLANHLGDIGAVCNDAAFPLMLAHCGVLRERVLRASDAAFGHRLMRDRIVPGGTAADLAEDGAAAIRALLANIRARFPALVRLYDNTASLQDRTVGTGRLSTALARQYGAGGYVGRASGRRFDARRAFACPPYDELAFDVPVLAEGDVNARVWIRIREVEQSLSLIEQILRGLPAGPVRADVTASDGPREGAATREGVATREGMAIVEGFRGDVLVWLRIAATGLVERCRLRDPSWFQWPLLEAAIEGNIVADFPLCNKSFNCSYSGCDL
ncbi:hydrogenase large subunit [Labrys monachus]|uniref:Ni,Fe-hydrogenase III large subunit n=1 Tax=Labrys monachus TaxID=217067 RepID=A0ABU0FIG4_9HYPH|nr:NADH-quinone oxidoreductase subunit C [Labrys monachus]MDQ0394403.1 Ni,Fe-hydrogenase III large subunit [Labrys monachus]